MASPPLSLKARALKYLAMREHSRAELARKLSRHAPDAHVLEQLLDELAARDWLSTPRYVASVAHRRGARLGTARVRQELAAQGIAPEAMRETLASLRASEPQRALAVWQQRFGRPAADADERARQTRFLLARGFPAEVVRQVVDRDGPASHDGQS